MSVAISSLIGFTLKCDSGRLPGRMLPDGTPTELMPRRCRVCLLGRDGSEVACGFSAHVVAIGKNGTHAVMRATPVPPARVAFDRVGRDACSETWHTCSEAGSGPAISSSLGLWRVVTDRPDLLRAVTVEQSWMSWFAHHARTSFVSVFSDGTMSHSNPCSNVSKNFCP